MWVTKGYCHLYKTVGYFREYDQHWRLPSILYHLDVRFIQGDGNCGFRTVAQEMYGDEGQWPLVGQDLLARATSNGEEYYDDCRKTFNLETYWGKKTDRECLLETLDHHGGSAEQSKRFNDAIHVQLVADVYDASVVQLYLEDQSFSVRGSSRYSLQNL